MKKFIVATLIIVVFIFYSFLYSHSNATPVLPNTSTGSGSSSKSSTSVTSSTPVATGTPGTTDTPGATPTTTSSSGSSYKDGSYTGSVADAQWGYIQVKVIIQGGKITDVQFLQAPSDHNRSVMINNDADPQLASEAIQAQSANVDIVTGATDSSQAFIQSLTDALAQAKV